MTPVDASRTAPATPQETGDVLLVFAHREEAWAFGDVAHVVTGVGKINAASTLLHALTSGSLVAQSAAQSAKLQAVGVSADHSEVGRGAIRRVIVLGTAGVVREGLNAPSLDHVYRIDAALQHDFSLPSPKLELPDAPWCAEIPAATIATGDVFVTDDAVRINLAAQGADLVDMETYAFASVCARMGVPLQVFKVPSDFADSATTDEDWDSIVHRKSEQLRAFWDAVVAETL